MRKGIDVSDNQGLINWDQVSDAGVDFAILRSVRRSGKPDRQFCENISGCRTHGIPVSVYKYTYATTLSAAKEEACQVVALLQACGMTGTMVWWDVEDRNTLQPLGRTLLTECIRAAQTVIENAGYRFGLYMGLFVYREEWFDFSRFVCPLWVARYPGKAMKKLQDNPPDQYKPYVGRAIWGWQWTDNGRVPGIGGAVDLDVCYQDLAEVVVPEKEPGVIYLVSVADVWTREQAETVQHQLNAMGINGVVHKVKIME